MARKRSLDDGPVWRDRITQEASRLFHERGFAETSIRDIADAVGISSSTLYHHFANKQDVLHAVVGVFMTDFLKATLPLLADTSVAPTERVRRVVRVHIEFSDDRRHEMLVGNPMRYALDDEHRQQGVESQTAYHRAFRATITEGCATGEFRVEDASLATTAVLDMLNGIREWFSAGGRLTRSQLVDRYVGLVLALLRATELDA